MDSLTDLILRYCLIFGRRFFAKEKIAFLRVISKELHHLGYQLDAKLAKLQLSKRRYQNFYNGYIGDVNKADIIICTYYDTSVKTFNLTTKYAFDSGFNKKSYLISILPIIAVFFISLVLNYSIFIPNIQESGFITFSGLCSLVTTLLFFYLVIRYSSGIPNQKNFICNSSSIVLILNLIKKLDKNQQQKIAFVLIDGGCSSPFGMRMLESYSKDIKKKTLIFMDSIGNGDEIRLFKPANYEPDLDNCNFLEGYIDTDFKRYILITSGKLDKLNRVRVTCANSRKDNALSTDRIEAHTEIILDLCAQLVNVNNK